jgi:hypothetical protein
MKVKRIKIVIAIVILLVVSLAIIYQKKNTGCDGCGGCDYENFTDRVKVKKIVLADDSIDLIYLKSIIDTNHIYQIDSYDYSVAIEKDFDEKEIKDTLRKYAISGERITHGCCTPYSIRTMKLAKK